MRGLVRELFDALDAGDDARAADVLQQLERWAYPAWWRRWRRWWVIA